MLVSFLLCLFLIFAQPVEAVSDATYLTINNPVRGAESWTAKHSSLDLVQYQYDQATMSALPVTWLLRYDSVIDSTHQSFFSSIQNQFNRLGAFLEITPRLAQDAGVSYDSNAGIFAAHNIFLNGYVLADRYKLIDTYMSRFQSVYGYTPRVVGAWYLDAQSLNYLRQKYTVIAVLNCDEQYETDQYRLWGGHVGSSYIPSARHALQPSTSVDNRIDLVVSRWAQRDLYNFYGRSKASLFSVQVNDYSQLDLDGDYFASLAALYTDHTGHDYSALHIGLENDDVSSGNRVRLATNFAYLKSQIDAGILKPVFLEDYSSDILRFFPVSSPTYAYLVSDPSGKSEGQVFWFQNAFYRFGLRRDGDSTEIIDFRVYDPALYEEFFDTPNQDSFLYAETPSIIDSVKYSQLTHGVFPKLSSLKLSRQDGLVKLTSDQGTLEFHTKKIVFQGLTPDNLTSSHIKTIVTPTTHVWQLQFPYSFELIHYWPLILLIVLSVIYLRAGYISMGFGFVLAATSLITLFRSGTLNSFGLGFWGPNSHDAVFHLSVIQKFASAPFDLSHPQLVGATIQNYHLVYDYLLGVISFITRISPQVLYFQIVPTILALFLVFLLESLMIKLKLNTLQKSLAYFIFFLGGSLGFIPAVIQSGNLFGGESIFWMHQSVSLFLNPPYVLSLVLLLLFFNLYFSRISKARTTFIYLALIGIILAQTKVYAFILLFAALVLSGQFLLALIILVGGILINLPFSQVSGIPFEFALFWFVQSMFASIDRLNIPRVSEAWSNYLASGNYLKLFMVSVLGTVVYFIGNLGLRLAALPELLSAKVSPTHRLIMNLILVGLAIPLVFVQKHNPWNTIQFSYYSLFFLSIYTAVTLSTLIKSRVGRIVLVLLLVAGSLTSVGTLRDYFGHYSSGRISHSELQLLSKLSQQPRGYVVSPVFDEDLARLAATPRPLYKYTSTAYISAFGNQGEFFSDTINLDITGLDYTAQSRDIERLYQTEDSVWADIFLTQSNLSYIIELPEVRMRLNPESLGFIRIFDQSGYTLYSRTR